MDTRIAYGATCLWWDSIANVATSDSGLPVCPYCKGVLYEMPSEDEWWVSVNYYAAANQDEDYPEFIKWLQGKCIPLRPDEAFQDALTSARAKFDAERVR